MLGDMVKGSRTCRLKYVDDDRQLVYEEAEVCGMVVGVVKKALGPYIGAYRQGLADEEYEQARLAVSHYVRLYEVKLHLETPSCFIQIEKGNPNVIYYKRRIS